MHRLTLRVLYTINSSPQYVLARSHRKVPVVVVQGDPRYGTTSLKACLDAICRSSPELLQDPSRDFSLYVLDPLETISHPPSSSSCAPSSSPSASFSSPSHAPSSSRHGTDQPPRGVAVGLGRMSSALADAEASGSQSRRRQTSHDDTEAGEEDDAVTATGTLVAGPGGVMQLEVVFLLRETPAIPTQTRTYARSRSPARSYSGTYLPTPPASHPTMQIHSQHQNQQPQPSSSSSSSTRPRATHPLSPISQTVGSRAVCLHTPPRKGRPPRDRDPAAAAVGTAVKVKGKTSAKAQRTERAAAPMPAPRQNSVTTVAPASNGGRTPDAGAEADADALVLDAERQRALMSVLEMIHTTGDQHKVEEDDARARAKAEAEGGGDDRAALVRALKALLAVADAAGTEGGGLQQAQQQNPSHQPAQQHQQERHQDDEIVLLNKENVDPAVFRRRGEGKGQPQPLQPAHQPHAPTHSKENTTTETRKRTLSQFMEDKERERDGARRKLEPASTRGRAHSMAIRTRSDPAPSGGFAFGAGGGGSLAWPYHPPSLLRAHPPPPPPGMHQRGQLQQTQTQTQPAAPAPAPAPLWPRLQTTSASSPPRPPRYVVPEWARTSTALKPRLADRGAPAAPTESSADGRKKEKEKEKEKKAGGARKRGGATRSSSVGGAKARAGRTLVEQSTDPIPPPQQQQQEQQPASDTTPPTTSSGATQAPFPALPIFASQTSTIASLSSRPSSPTEPTPPARAPRTPSPSPSLPSLFTPVPRRLMTTTMTPTHPACVSPLFTPQVRAERWSTPGSRSPSPADGRRRGSSSALASSEDERDDDDDDDGTTLARAFEDNEFPPSSLPIASSDVEYPEARSTTPPRESSDEQHATTTPTPKERPHWSVDLPPSSPPPPSSPALSPQDHREGIVDASASDDDALVNFLLLQQLDVPSSDAEGQGQGGVDVLACLPTDGSEAQLPQDLETCFDFAALLSDNAASSNMGSFDVDSSSSFDALNHLDDPFASLADASAGGAVDFDFSEFWESVKPLVGCPEQQQQEQELGFNTDEIDHARLAEQMHALFGGCLV